MRYLAAPLVIAFAFLLTLPAAAQGSWQREPLPTDQLLRALCFTDSLHGWLAGDSGTILHTNDAGRSWIRQQSGTDGPVASIFFLDSLHGWASAFSFDTAFMGSWLLSTRNGGATWTRKPYPVENIFITCITYFDTLTGWMGGKPHALVHTTDGGETWHQAAIDTSILAFMPVLSIRFWDRQTGYASGGMFDIAGVIWRTTNGGERWSAMDAMYAPADEVHALHLFSAREVMGAGGDPDFGYGVGMIRSWDGGDHWSYQELGMQGNAYDLAFRNELEVWAPLGQQRKMIVSMDSGANWNPVPTPDTAVIYRVVFPDSLHGYATGAHGAFLRYIPRNVGAPEPPKPATGPISLTASPNPFGPATLLRVSVPAETSRVPAYHLRISLTDMPGKTVREWTLGPFTEAMAELPVDGSGLKPGIYLCRAEVMVQGEKAARTAICKMVKY